MLNLPCARCILWFPRWIACCVKLTIRLFSMVAVGRFVFLVCSWYSVCIWVSSLLAVNGPATQLLVFVLSVVTTLVLVEWIESIRTGIRD